MSNAEARFNNSLRPRKPEGSLGRTAQDGHLDSHTAPELCMEVGEEGDYIPVSLHCRHQNDSCIKMGSDESHFNVSVGSDGQSHRTVSTNHNLFEEKGEPKRYRTEVLPLTSLTLYTLGQTGSQVWPNFPRSFIPESRYVHTCSHVHGCSRGHTEHTRVEADVQGSQSLLVLTVSVNVK